jgi:hypothetical protein
MQQRHYVLASGHVMPKLYLQMFCILRGLTLHVHAHMVLQFKFAQSVRRLQIGAFGVCAGHQCITWSAIAAAADQAASKSKLFNQRLTQATRSHLKVRNKGSTGIT